MPLPVVIVEHRISLAAERVAAPVICDSRVVTTIKGGVLCPIHRDVSIGIDRDVIAIAKLIRVALTVNISVPCRVHRDVSLAINCCVVASANLSVPCPISRDTPVAIRRNASVAIEGSVRSLVKRLVSGEVPLAHRLQSGISIGHKV
jgi:hypothetical protein